MKKILLACVAVAIGLSAYVYLVGRAEIAATRAQSQQMNRMAEAIEQLTRRLDRLIQERERSNMADVNKTEGDASLNHGVTIPWTSGTLTISLTVYKASANETPEELRQRIVDATDKWMRVYPPNTQ